MTAGRWLQLGHASGDDFIDARMQLHRAVQLLASFAGEALEPLRDDLHRSLRWDAPAGAFTTGSPSSAPDARVELGIADFELRVRICDDVDPFPLRDRTLDEAREWLRERVAAHMELDLELQPPEFDIPDHPVAAGVPFDAHPDALEAWTRWYHDGTLLLEGIAACHDLPHRGVRVWPHHFDAAVLFEVGRGADGTRCTVGAGMAPFDPATPTPYWYVTPYPYQLDADRADVAPGRWQTEGWLGAVLGAAEVVGNESRDQFLQVHRWTHHAVHAAADTLGVEVDHADGDDAPDVRAPGPQVTG